MFIAFEVALTMTRFWLEKGSSTMLLFIFNLPASMCSVEFKWTILSWLWSKFGFLKLFEYSIRMSGLAGSGFISFKLKHALFIVEFYYEIKWVYFNKHIGSLAFQVIAVAVKSFVMAHSIHGACSWTLVVCTVPTAFFANTWWTEFYLFNLIKNSHFRKIKIYIYQHNEKLIML